MAVYVREYKRGYAWYDGTIGQRISPFFKTEADAERANQIAPRYIPPMFTSRPFMCASYVRDWQEAKRRMAIAEEEMDRILADEMEGYHQQAYEFRQQFRRLMRDSSPYE